mmetsp:Transcript_5389/g.12491  ORF Transcript_5389/g.12491 Transcript_5389/m.12491 type:complete len:376 (+) Transcript_5389:578-1705(+)
MHRSVEGGTRQLARGRGEAGHHDEPEAAVGVERAVDEARRRRVKLVVGAVDTHLDRSVRQDVRAAHSRHVTHHARRRRLPPRVADDGGHVGAGGAQHKGELVVLALGLRDGREGELVPSQLIELALLCEVGAVELVGELGLLRALAAARALGHTNVVRAQSRDRALGEARAHGGVTHVGDDPQIADEPQPAHRHRHRQRLLVVLVAPEVSDHDHVELRANLGRVRADRAEGVEPLRAECVPGVHQRVRGVVRLVPRLAGVGDGAGGGVDVDERRGLCNPHLRLLANRAPPPFGPRITARLTGRVIDTDAALLHPGRLGRRALEQVCDGAKPLSPKDATHRRIPLLQQAEPALAPIAVAHRNRAARNNDAPHRRRS